MLNDLQNALWNLSLIVVYMLVSTIGVTAIGLILFTIVKAVLSGLA